MSGAGCSCRSGDVLTAVPRREAREGLGPGVANARLLRRWVLVTWRFITLEFQDGSERRIRVSFFSHISR